VGERGVGVGVGVGGTCSKEGVDVVGGNDGVGVGANVGVCVAQVMVMVVECQSGFPAAHHDEALSVCSISSGNCV
jgi:hypothetical protein